MANKYYQQRPDRSPLADTGLLIALAVTVVTVIKLLMYGITYVSVIWLAITLVYVVSTTMTSANSAVRKGMTIFYMCVSTLAFFAAFVYDKPIRPKTELNMGSNIDNINFEDENADAEDEEIKVETPKPVVVETDNIVREDASTFEEVSNNPVEEEYPTATFDNEDDVEVIDLHSDEPVNSTPSVQQENAGQKEQDVEFDESFK